MIEEHLTTILLFLRNGSPVAVVYLRAGYSPNDYPSEAVCGSFPSVKLQLPIGQFYHKFQ